MYEGTVERRIRCPWCAATFEIILDLSAGDQSYVEDCQVCCQPMQLTFQTDGQQSLALQVERA